MRLEHKIVRLVLILLILQGFFIYLGFNRINVFHSDILAEQSRNESVKTLALTAQVHFKKQVQEWKNILLRGADQNDYETYYRQFQREERITRELMKELRSQLAISSLSANLCNEFLDQHEFLSSRYARVLANYKSYKSNSAFLADTEIRGEDRKPTDLIDELVEQIDLDGKAALLALEKANTRFQNWVITLVLIVNAAVCALLLIYLRRWITKPISLVVDFAKKIRGGDFSGELDLQSDGDIGLLADSLNSMREELDQTYSELIQRNQELVEARDKAQELNQLKTDFLANVSHEIRTPMSGIVSMVGLLEQSGLSDTQSAYAEIIESSSEALMKLVDDILDLSTIESGKLKLKPKPFSIETILEDALQAICFKAEEKGLDYAVNINGLLPAQVFGDPWRLRQVLLNLLSNAVKFTDSGQVLLTCEVALSTQTSCELLLSVVDSGIGIAPSQREKIFENFEQIDNSTERTYGGMGLGLSITKKLVEIMGGEITVGESELGGSEFTVRIRYSIPSSMEHLSGKLKTDHNKEAILICDRVGTSRRIIELSEKMGVRVSCVSGLASALSLLHAHADQENVPDAIILDSRLASSAEESRVLEQFLLKNHIPLISLAKPGSKVIEDRVVSQVNTTIVQRPLRRKHWRNALRRLFHGHNSRALLPPNVARKSKPANDSLERASVLVVEDNIVNQQIIVAVLERLNIGATVVENGQLAVDTAVHGHYDCILMDCQMPVMDGYRATELIRKNEGQDKRNLIIALTAHAMAGDKERCLAAGMDEYLTKPIKPKEFSEILLQLLKLD